MWTRRASARCSVTRYAKSKACCCWRSRTHFSCWATPTAAISAVMAKRMRVPVYHMEAGNRSFDENVPEETNRRLVDHVADFNLVYTEHARRNLLAEGFSGSAYLTDRLPDARGARALPAADRRVGRPPRERVSRQTATSWSAHTGRRTSTHRSDCRRCLSCLTAVRDEWDFRSSFRPTRERAYVSASSRVPRTWRASASTSRSDSTTSTAYRSMLGAYCQTVGRSVKNRRCWAFLRSPCARRSSVPRLWIRAPS